MTSWTRRNSQNTKRSRKAWTTRKRMLAARGGAEGGNGTQKERGDGIEVGEEDFHCFKAGVERGDETAGH